MIVSVSISVNSITSAYHCYCYHRFYVYSIDTVLRIAQYTYQTALDLIARFEAAKV